MKFRSTAWATVSVLAWSLVSLAPAHAAVPDTPTIGALSTATAGHVTGTVTSSAPYVVVTFGGSYLGIDETVAVSTAGGTAGFDLETWGHPPGVTVAASSCPTPEHSGSTCSAWTESAPFAPTDVRPTISFSGDTQLGPAEAVTITTSDTGGGRLVARWVNGPVPSFTYAVAASGTTTIPATQLPEGTGSLQVRRCSASGAWCSDFSPPISKSYEVRLSMAVTPGPLKPLNLRTPVRDLLLTTNRAGSYQLSYELVSLPGDEPVAGTHRETTGVLSNGSATARIDGTALPDGAYRVVGTLRVADPAFGTFEVDLDGPSFNVRKVVPVITSATASPRTVYPRINRPGYPATLRVTTSATADPDQQLSAEIRDASGRTVDTVKGSWTRGPGNLVFDWTSKQPGNRLAAPGDYTLVVVNQWGNEAAVRAPFKVSGQRLIPRVWRKTVTAAGSLDSTFLGRCSTLRRPSSRQWAGSLGYYANTRCGTQTWKSSAVSTLHYTRVPAGLKFGTVAVTARGGAARSRPRSIAVLRYLDHEGYWHYERTVGAKVRSYNGRPAALDDMLLDGRFVAWGFYTAYKNRYDVRNFTVTIRYHVLSAT